MRAGSWCLTIAAALAASIVGAVPWSVSVDGLERTAEARPLAVGATLLVDLDGLAGALGLVIGRGSEVVTVANRGGERWTGAPGGDSLSGSTAVALGLQRFGRAEWLVAAAIAARLSGTAVEIDAQHSRIAFRSPAAPGPRSSESWSSFTLPKSADERRETSRLAEDVPLAPPRPPAVLPAQHESLRVGVGASAIVGADAAAEVFADGWVAGIATALDTFVVLGPAGARLQSGGADLVGVGGLWHARVGDLSSDLVGSARGARVLARRGAQLLGLGFYAPRGTAGAKPRFTVSDDLLLRPWLRLNGEVASDGSWLLRSTGTGARGRASAFVRRRAEGAADWGFDGSVTLGAGWSALAAEQHAAPTRGGATGRFEVRSAGVRWAGASGAAVSAGLSRILTGEQQVRLTELSAQRIFGRVHLFGRVQDRRLSAAPDAPEQAYDDFLGGVGFAGRRGRLDLQLVASRAPAGELAVSEQVVASFALSRRSELRAVASLADRVLGDRRFEWHFAVREDFSFSAEVGTIPPFDPATLAGTTGGDRVTRVRLSVRKSWDVATPARGGSVVGAARDLAGEGWPGIGVILGPFRTYTDRDGAFAFTHVPPGTYEARLDPHCLAPGLVALGPPRQVVVVDGSEDELLFALAPLGQVSGWVYIDRDGDGGRGPNEGLEGAIVVLDGLAVTSDADGAFLFNDVTPGRHTLRLAADRLGPALRAAAGASRELGLPPGASLTAVALRVLPFTRPIQFQETP